MGITQALEKGSPHSQLSMGKLCSMAGPTCVKVAGLEKASSIGVLHMRRS